MKKEMRKTYLKAVGKILFAITIVVQLIVVFATSDDLDTVSIVVCSVLWGICVLVYFLVGIGTLKSGTKQAKEYIAGYSYGEAKLEEEYQRSKKFGGLHVGELHIFANATNGFYIIPIKNIESLGKRHHYSYDIFASKSMKRFKGYFYLYIKEKANQVVLY